MNSRSVFKWILILVLIAAVAFAVWYFFRKSDPDPASGLKPRVEMTIAHISEITDSTIKMELKTLVHNPLPVGMHLKNINYVVKMNDKTIVEDHYNKPLEVKAADSSLLTLPAKVKIRNLRVEGDEEAAKGQDSANYHFKTILHFEKPFLGKDSLVLDIDKRLPLYRLPKIRMAGYDFKKLGLKESDIVVKVEVGNMNPFSLEFQDPVYAMDLGKQKRFAEGAVKGITKVKSKSRDIYEIPLEVSLGKVIKAGAQMLGKGKDLPFSFYFKSKIKSESDVLNNSDINLIMDGELKDLEAFQKNLGRK
ncbi:MAG: Water stress and hypersensitive response domain-containing protein [Dyadobacter sp.]|uniref:LEA type 2 family protein n=1 Tax=Dyadobacter sp. TaxID=1914288 RepID=UPI001B118A13|nr:LEA type 2 family protein [Dyadobacter sp.]MBO9613989.1 Water stress and hypersensitive response domain-containing protein [Dyadobacter sp.]